jgi:phosphohistidine phosphatase
MRPLSEKGRLQAERMGAFLARADLDPDAILSSPKLRAVETAELVAGALGRPVRRVDQLGGPLDIDALEALLEAAGNPERPLLVGHDPDFSDLAADLVGLPDLAVRKGALVRIDVRRPLSAGDGALRWLVPPDLLGRG